MKLPAWTKKVFAPAFSSSPSTTSSSPFITSPALTTSYPATTLTTSTSSSQTPNDDLAKPKGSIQSYMSFSTLPNVRKHIPLLGVPDANTNSSTASQISAIFLSHIRDPRAPSSPKINKTSYGIVDGSTKPPAIDLEKNDNDSGDDSNDKGENEEDGEDVSGSPTTTTIYYYPPLPKKRPTETSALRSPSSPSLFDKSADMNSSPRLAKADPEVRCLRHIDPIPSAAGVSPSEVNHFQQHCQLLSHTHQNHLSHDKNCEFAHYSALDPSGQRPICKRNTDPRQQERDNLFLPHNTPQIHPPSNDKPGTFPSPTSPPLPLPKLKIPIIAPPFPNPPVYYQVRRSSANYSLEALKNKRKNSSSSTSRPTSRISDTTIASSTSSNSSSGNNSSGSPQHSENTLQKLCESTHCMSHFGSSTSFSSSTSKQATTSTSKVQIAAKSGAPAVAVWSNDSPTPAAATTAAASNLPSAFPPRNSRLISRALQVLASDADTSTTTTTTTVTTIITTPTTIEKKFEQLIQKIDTLAHEVEIMKQKHSYNSNGISDAPLYPKNHNKTTNLSTVSLPLPSTLSLKALASKNNSATSLTCSFPPLPPPLLVSNNNNNNPMPPSNLPILPHFRISGNNKPIMHHHSNDKSSRSMTRLQNLPPPPTERPPSPPTYPSSSSSCSFSSSTPSSSPIFSSSIRLSLSQRGDTNPSRDKPYPSLPPSRIPIPHAPRHQRPISSLNRSSSVLFPSPPTTPSFAPTYARATTTNYTGSVNNVHSKRLTMINATTTTTNDDISDAVTPSSTSATPAGSGTVTTKNYSDDEEATLATYFTSNDSNNNNNDNNSSIIKGQDQDQLGSESTIISRTVSKTPAPPTTPPPPPPRSYLTITTTAANDTICGQTMAGMTMAGMTGPPRRPPRPPQLSVDMKEILLLMDSRLGAKVVVPLSCCVGTG